MKKCQKRKFGPKTRRTADKGDLNISQTLSEPDYYSDSSRRKANRFRGWSSWFFRLAINTPAWGGFENLLISLANLVTILTTKGKEKLAKNMGYWITKNNKNTTLNSQDRYICKIMAIIITNLQKRQSE